MLKKIANFEDSAVVVDGKIITYICHGGIPVTAADLIKGEKATGWQASKDSIEIMGGEYNENWAAVVDGRQVSGRTPPEIPEYVDAIMVALLSGMKRNKNNHSRFDIGYLKSNEI